MGIRKHAIKKYRKYFYMCCSAVLLFVLILLLTSFARYNRKTQNNNSIENNNPDKILYNPTQAKINKPRLAIIIDDFGKNRSGVKEMMDIDLPLTIAIMPFLEYSTQDANTAHEKGHEVILHLPMQSQEVDIASWLGPKPIKVDLKEDEIRKIVIDSMDAVPHAVGMNIHKKCFS